MKKLVTLFLLAFTTIAFSQENQKWTVGFGINFIDNSGMKNNQYFKVADQWNFIPTVSKISVERKWTSLIASDLSVSVNQLSKDKLQNGKEINEDFNYVSLDANGKFYFDEFIVKSPSLDVCAVLGLGANLVDDYVNQTANLGLGLNYWLQPNVGLRLQTLGKFAFNEDKLSNNHIQHSVELIFKF